MHETNFSPSSFYFIWQLFLPNVPAAKTNMEDELGFIFL